eukprot:2535880-Prymnesium_polylepis.1
MTHTRARTTPGRTTQMPPSGKPVLPFIRAKRLHEPSVCAGAARGRPKSATRTHRRHVQNTALESSASAQR